MARRTATEQTKSVDAVRPTRTRLSTKNRQLLAFLDEWMSTPDDMGKEWWDEFEKQLKENKFRIDRLCE